MRAILPGNFSEYRHFISEEVPELVYRLNMDSKAGGKFVRTRLKTDRLQNWKVIHDGPDGFEASVFLGKSSNKVITGFRRIVVEAREEEGQTILDLRSKNRALGIALVGLLFCIIPGVVLFVVKVMHDSFERRVIGKVGAEIKKCYPEAVLEE